MEDLKEEISNAIKRIKQGIPGKVDDLVMAIGKNGYFLVGLETRIADINAINKNIILDELFYCKKKVQQLIDLSDDFKAVTLGRKIKYSVDYNYGMAYTEICSMIDDKIKWVIDGN